MEVEVEAEAGGKGGKHCSKRTLRNKSLIIRFDEDDRKEFITGFHKRKKQRRKQAEKEKLNKEREKRLKQRRQKRLALKAAAEEMSSVCEQTLESMNGEEVDEENYVHISRNNGTLIYDDEDTTTIVRTCEIGSERYDTDIQKSNMLTDPIYKTEIPLRAKKQKSFKRTKKKHKNITKKSCKGNSSGKGSRKKGKHNL